MARSENSIINVNASSSKIKELKIFNCKSMADLNLYQAKLDTLQISSCPINELDTSDSVIQSFIIDNSSLANSDLSDMKAKNFTLTNVTLDQSLDFSGTKVENFLPKNVTKASGAQLKMDGSNIKF